MVPECIVLRKDRPKWPRGYVRMVPDNAIKNPLGHPPVMCLRLGVDIELCLVRVITDLVTVSTARFYVRIALLLNLQIDFTVANSIMLHSLWRIFIRRSATSSTAFHFRELRSDGWGKLYHFQHGCGCLQVPSTHTDIFLENLQRLRSLWNLYLYPSSQVNFPFWPNTTRKLLIVALVFVWWRWKCLNFKAKVKHLPGFLVLEKHNGYLITHGLNN